ncbi:MAG: nucleotide exchange factor GrpE [bacterium]|nr:nucleotide exchange factor GrpE [bacterium]
MPKKPSSPKLSRLEKELAAEHESKLRLAADFANFQKRVETEKDALRKYASRDLLEKLFPIFDNFYRASTHAPEVSLEDLPNLTEGDYQKIFNYFSGLRLIEKQLEQVLGEAGLKRIPTADQPFDHNLHEAISHEPSVEVPADHIIAEIEAGWTIDDTVIKPAKVRVSKG